jgi:hypothetical protein
MRWCSTCRLLPGLPMQSMGNLHYTVPANASSSRLKEPHQRCVLAMLLFCLAIQPTVMGITSVCERRINLWEADDGTLLRRISEVAKALEIIRDAEDETGSLMRLDKTSAWNHVMSAPFLRVVGWRLLMSDDGAPDAGIVWLGSPVGLPSFVHSFMNGRNAEMERLAALVQELAVPQLSYYIMRVCLAVKYLVHTARTTAPELLDALVGDFDVCLDASLPARYAISRTMACNRYSCPSLLRVAVSWTSAAPFVRRIQLVFLILRSPALCSPGALPPPPVLRLLCWLMRSTYRALDWQMCQTCNLRPSLPVSAKHNPQ